MTDSEQFFHVSQLAAITGEKASTWRKRIFRKEISYHKLGRNVRISRSALERWLSERTVPAQANGGRA